MAWAAIPRNSARSCTSRLVPAPSRSQASLMRAVGWRVCPARSRASLLRASSFSSPRTWAKNSADAAESPARIRRRRIVVAWTLRSLTGNRICHLDSAHSQWQESSERRALGLWARSRRTVAGVAKELRRCGPTTRSRKEDEKRRNWPSNERLRENREFHSSTRRQVVRRAAAPIADRLGKERLSPDVSIHERRRIGNRQVC